MFFKKAVNVFLKRENQNFIININEKNSFFDFFDNFSTEKLKILKKYIDKNLKKSSLFFLNRLWMFQFFSILNSKKFYVYAWIIKISIKLL